MQDFIGRFERGRAPIFGVGHHHYHHYPYYTLSEFVVFDETCCSQFKGLEVGLFTYSVYDNEEFCLLATAGSCHHTRGSASATILVLFFILNSHCTVQVRDM